MGGDSMRLVYAGIPIVSLLLSACGTAEWKHPNKPKEMYAQDYNRCERESIQNPRYQGGTKLVLQQAIERCLEKQGWRLQD
jgi:hypothetical protein